MHDVGTDVVQETAVVRDDHAGDLGLADEVLFEPGDGLYVCRATIVKGRDVSDKTLHHFRPFAR